MTFTSECHYLCRAEMIYNSLLQHSYNFLIIDCFIVFSTDNSQRDALRCQVVHKSPILLLALAFPRAYHKKVHQLYCQFITATAVISRLESGIMLFEGCYIHAEIAFLNLVRMLINTIFHCGKISMSS